MTDNSPQGKQPSQPEYQQRYPDGFWDHGHEYLQQCAILQHNPDYLEFLVSRVWKLDQVCRLADFGCGYGKMGSTLMPLLVKGSTYTGIDQSPVLIAKARQLSADNPWQAEFYEGSIYKTSFPDNSFDVTMTHTVLMHIPHPEKVIQEMIRVTRPNGMVITCEANRNAHAALFHLEEVNHQETAPLELFQTINKEIRKRTGVDHNIGIKLPVLMHKAGLRNVEARISDSVRFLYPPMDSDYKNRLFKAICDEGYGHPQPSDEQRERWKENLVGFGIPEEEAEAEITRELEENFLEKGQQYHTVLSSLLTWSFGYV